jgi:hypothetical protein
MCRDNICFLCGSTTNICFLARDISVHDIANYYCKLCRESILQLVQTGQSLTAEVKHKIIYLSLAKHRKAAARQSKTKVVVKKRCKASPILDAIVIPDSSIPGPTTVDVVAETEQ